MEILKHPGDCCPKGLKGNWTFLVGCFFPLKEESKRSSRFKLNSPPLTHGEGYNNTYFLFKTQSADPERFQTHLPFNSGDF